jgi:signal transduction histidine kinase
VKLLIVDDEIPQMKALCNTLEGQGYQTTGVSSPQGALELLLENRFDLILTDLMMPEMDGIAFLRAALERDPSLVGIIMTGRGSIDSAVQAMQSGALDYILKPFKLSAILPVISRALAIRQLRLENTELQDKIRQRTMELEAANKDLESFSYSVSHDLRSPLRRISGFAQVLLEDCSPELSPKAQELLSVIIGNAGQMWQLIEGLLRFSRLGRQHLLMEPVEVEELVHEVLSSMSSELEGRHIEILAQDLPGCFGDPALLKQVFINLLSNAFKFTRQREPATIKIGCICEQDENVYFIQDNGIGFDMKDAQKLFGVFQRLHPDEQFEGTGVGLSIVQRIVERHGGKVWAEAEEGKGATFYFRLKSGVQGARSGRDASDGAN